MGRRTRRVSWAWVFVSHSTQDLHKVRRVRNYLERRGAEPLLFFLKALTSKPELRQLLRREIDERNIFLLCDSPSARRSRWVREEVEHVRSQTSGKIYSEIRLDWPWERQKAELDALTRRTTVYLSYARSDAQRVTPYVEYLDRADFAVLKDQTKPHDSSWERRLDDTVRHVKDRGIVVAFLSNRSLEREEKLIAEGALLRPDGIVLVELDPIPALSRRMSSLRRVHYSAEFESSAKRLASLLGLEEPNLERRQSDE